MNFSERLIKQLLTAIAFLLPCISHALPGDIFYVDIGHPSASDTYSKTQNSESAPWKSIQHAANNLQAGETVLVKDGIYTELFTGAPNTGVAGIKPQNSGTAGNPITYKAFPGHRPIIEQNMAGSGFYLQGHHYITIDGFEIRKSAKGGIWNNYGPTTTAGSTHIIIQNNVIHDNNGGGNQGGIKFDGVDLGEIRNNIIHTIRVDGDVRHLNSACIHSYNMSNTIIENNELYNCGNGVFHKQAPVNKDGAIIRNNIIHDVGKGTWYSNAGANSPPHINQAFYSNIVYNTSTCILAKTKDIPLQSDGMKIYNNVFDSCGVFSNGVLNTEIYNNIIYQEDPAVRHLTTENGDPAYWESDITYIDHNNYYPTFYITLDLYKENNNYKSLSIWKSACASTCPDTLSVSPSGPDQNGLALNPEFIDRPGRNYKLATTSALRGKGRSGVDIGAYPTGTEIIGPAIRIVHPLSPKAPTDVNIIIK